MTTIRMSSMKNSKDNAGGSIYGSDSMDSETETDAPTFRIIDPSSIMEEEFYEDEDDEEEEEYDEEELLHFAETRPIISLSQQQPHSRKRKQEIQHLNREEEQLKLLTVQEYKAMEKQSKSSKKCGKDKLYMLNPDDFKNDRIKQQQIRRAKVTHNHHRRKNREIQRLQGENAKLKDLVSFYEQREKRIRQHCRCEGVSKLLSNRPNLTGGGGSGAEPATLNEDKIPKITIVKQSSDAQTQTLSSVIELQRPATSSTPTHASQPDLKRAGLTLPRNNDVPPSQKQPPRMFPGPSTSAASSNRIISTTASSSGLKLTNFLGHQYLPGSSISKQQNLIASPPKPPPLVPSPMIHRSPQGQGPSTSTFATPRNVLIAHKGANGTRLVQVAASSLSSFAGMFDHTTAHKKLETKPIKTYSRRKVDNYTPKIPSTSITTPQRIINPLSRLRKTLNLISTIVRNGREARNGNNRQFTHQSQKPLPEAVLGSEITDEILRHWSDEVFPLPVARITASTSKVQDTIKTCMPSPSPPSPIIGNCSNDDESSYQRRSKRSAATSRLSTAELLGGTKLQKVSKMPEQAINNFLEGAEINSLDNVDWDSFEIQYLQPRQYEI